MPQEVDWVAVLVLGAAAGAVELATRHPTYRFGALSTAAGLAFVAITAGVAAGILWMYRAVGATFIPNSLAEYLSPTAGRVWQIVLTGLTPWSLTRVGVVRRGKDGELLPASLIPFVQAALALIDEAIRRDLAGRTVVTMAVIMQDVSFARAKSALVMTCINLMPLATAEDARRCGDKVRAVERMDMDDAAKALNLGTVLAGFCGVDVVRSAVASLGTSIRAVPSTSTDLGLKPG